MNMPDELLPVIEWWEKDGKKHLAIGGCILLAGLAGWGFNAWRQSRTEAAAAACGISRRPWLWKVTVRISVVTHSLPKRALPQME